ncbi:MAG: hypothetical protein MSS80_07740 [Mollicutes bacterium]|nr:hypothetical protein [Mollicutes bacterium]
MIDKENILKYFKNKNINVNAEKIDNILQSINKEEIIKSQENRFEYKIWDKKSPINGVDAKTIIGSRSYKIGQAYLVYIDNKVVYFQDHNPNKEGYEKMTKSEAEKIAEDFIQKQIEESVDNIIINKVLNEVLSEEK